MSKYDDMTITEVVHDFAVVRGDLVEEYARRQLVRVLQDKFVRAIGAARAREYEAFQRGFQGAAEVDGAETRRLLATAWDDGYQRGLLDEADGSATDNPYREETA